MQIKELIINWISESSLFEMAHERKIAINQVRKLQFTLAKHLVKVLYLNSPDNYNHWIQEINNYLFMMDAIRVKNGKSKNLKPQDYQLILWEEPLGHGVEAINVIQRQLVVQYPNTTHIGINEYQIYEILHKIYSELIYDIPSGKFNGIQQYLQKHIEEK